MKMVESEYTNEVLSTGFIQKEALAKAMRRELNIEASAAENEIHEYNPAAAWGNDNPGGTCCDMMEDM